jgi:cysteinyl-tRNA synthetase
MALELYNTLSRKKEKFEPLNEGHVGMYVCGPTVYGDPHLGHARPYTTFDVLSRYLQFLGNKVRYVRNITDVGHLENDADEGEDKIAKKARLEELEPMEIVQYYTLRFRDAMQKLNNQPPSIEPTASGHIIEQIQIIDEIIANGYAYVVDGSVYFDVPRYNEDYPYGKLSGRKLEDMMANTRALDGQDEKRNAVDFALWKKAKPEHIMRWPSKWSDGFPGWHLECTAMSTRYLGETFDIHGGGMDLQFPHHEAEIAQSCGSKGKEPARFWMHNNMITINGQKMGKSLGNFITLEELFSGSHEILEQAYSPMTVRFYILQAQYRSTLDFSNDALQAAEKGLDKLLTAGEALIQLKAGNTDDFDVAGLKAKCLAAMDDDINTPIAISHLFEGVKWVNAMVAGKASLSEAKLKELQDLFNLMVHQILGLERETVSATDNSETDALMDLVLKLRGNAKDHKDWGTADTIRDHLKEIGIQIKDSKEGSSWEYEK